MSKTTASFDNNAATEHNFKKVSTRINNMPQIDILAFDKFKIFATFTGHVSTIMINCHFSLTRNKFNLLVYMGSLDKFRLTWINL